MNSKHIALAFLFSIYHLAFGISPVQAQSCTTQYGGTTTCAPTDLTINKQVKNPSNGLFVENLTASDPAYSPGSEVLFRLIIKNASNLTFSTATVKDVFPEHLAFVSGPGTYDSATRTLTFSLDNILSGQTFTQEILAKVATIGLPANQSIFCKTNTATVTASNRSDWDSSQLCVQTTVLGATTLPAAGFDDLLLLLPFAGVGLGGLALLKKKVSN